MKKQFLLLVSFILITGYLSSQTTYSWRSEATNGEWDNNQNWWDGSQITTAGSGILSFENNNQTSMTNNFANTLNTQRIYFESGSSVVRTINNGTVRLFDNTGDNPMIRNNSAATHIMNFALEGDGDAADPLIIEINSDGGLTFGGVVNNQGSVINIEGTTTTNTSVVFSEAITGSGGLYKTNSNITITLAGNNSFTGQTTIDAGTIEVTGGLGATDIRIGLNGHLDLQSSVSVPSVAERGTSDGGTIAIGSTYTLTIDGADKGDLYQNTISGDGNLLLNASGNTRLDLYGNNTFTGQVTVSGGTLRISHPNGLGTTDAGTNVNDGGVLELNAANDYPAESLVLNGTGILQGGALRKTSTGTQQFPGSITLISNTRINNESGTLDLRGELHLGGYTLYIGTTTSLVMGSGSSFASGADKTTDDGALFKDGGSFFTLRPSAQLTGNITLKEGEIRISTGSIIPEGGTFIIHDGTILSSDGATTRTVQKNISLLGDFTLASNNSGDVNIEGAINLNNASRRISVVNNSIISGQISNGSLIKSGSGTLTLFGNSDYTGTTVVEEGILELQGSLASSALTVNNGSKLIVSGNDVTVASLTIESGGSVEIEPGKSLTVSGSFTNSAGVSGVLIKSDATGTGSLIQNTTGVNATMQRYMNNADWSNWKDGWHFLGSPVADQTISPAFTTEPATEYDFYLWNEPTNEWVNFKNQNSGGGTAPYFDVVNGSNNFELGRGYMAAYDVEGVKSFSGALNVTDVPVSGLGITGTSGNRSWHLLGNPFSSALTWDASAEWALTNIAGVAKIWNEVNQSYTDLTSSPSTVIPATNGFMVQVSEVTGSLTIPAAKREHSSQAFYKSDVSGMMLTAKSHTAGNAQEARIVINPDATTGFDLMYDSEFLAGHAPSFYSVAGDFKLSTNSLPVLTAETEIPFVFVKNAGSQFSIETSGFEDVPGIPHLYDLKTGTSQNLVENPVYNFTASAGDDPNRFLLKFNSVGIAENIAGESIADIWSFNNQIYLNMKSPANARVELFNTTGQLVFTKTMAVDGLTQINPQLTTGWYVVKVTTTEGMASQKVFIQ